MQTNVIIGGAIGLMIGAVTGLFAFGNIISGIGIGICLGAAISGVLLAYGYEHPDQ